MMSISWIFLISGLFGIVFLFVGIWLGINKGKEINDELMVIRNNMLVKTITNWLRLNNEAIKGQLIARGNLDVSKTLTKIADQIDNNFLKKSIK